MSEPFRGAPHTVAHIKRLALAAQGYYPLRLLAEDIVGRLGSKDYLSEILAVYYWVLAHTRYANDPRTVELVRSPREVLARLERTIVELRGTFAGKTAWKPSLDCLPGDTLLLKRDMTFVKLSDLRAGDEIWGLDRWSRVEATVCKGDLPVDAIRMNNGSTFFATADHSVFVEECSVHAPRRCECPTAPRRGTRYKGRRRIKVKVADLRPGMVLTQPDRIASGTGMMDPGRAYIEGLYLSDGWHQPGQFYISGQDGCPKEAQKAEVAAICARLGIPTKMARKAIAVTDKAWTRRMKQMGIHAPQKHALDINLELGAAAELLRGIMADSGANTRGPGRTFTTTSYDLMLQTRVLHKMLGETCSERFISNHGGLGQNPIWRLGVRRRTEGSRIKNAKQLRVKDIERSVATVPVYDLQTDDHYVYLPQADVTVSNCDDLTTLYVGMFLALGREVRIVTVAFRDAFYAGKRQYGHVYVQVREPRTGQWIVLDPVAAEDTGDMLRRVKAVKIWPIA